MDGVGRDPVDPRTGAAANIQTKTLLRFSLRLLMVAVSVLSVLLAVLGPLVRAQPPDVRRLFLWAIVISVVVAVAGLAVFCVRRWRVETCGGKLLLRPKPPTRWFEYLLPVILIVIFVGVHVGTFLTLASIMRDVSRLERQMGWWPPTVSTISIIVSAPPILGVVYGFTLLWWRVTPMTLEICENGIGVGALKFLPWKAVTGHHWSDGKRATVLTVSAGSRKYTAVVRFDEKDSVQRLLDAKGTGI